MELLEPQKSTFSVFLKGLMVTLTAHQWNLAFRASTIKLFKSFILRHGLMLISKIVFELHFITICCKGNEYFIVGYKTHRWNRIISCSQETLSDKESDNELDPVPVEKTDDEMLFVYQSKDMQRLYQQLGNT